MRHALIAAFALACGCATTTQRPLVAQNDEKETRCRLVGPLTAHSGYHPRNGVVDETLALGPTRIVWMNLPANGSLIKTEGFLYACDAPL
jgi:hypothetical protein